MEGVWKRVWARFGAREILYMLDLSLIYSRFFENTCSQWRKPLQYYRLTICFLKRNNANVINGSWNQELSKIWSQRNAEEMSYTMYLSLCYSQCFLPQICNIFCHKYICNRLFTPMYVRIFQYGSKVENFDWFWAR